MIRIKCPKCSLVLNLNDAEAGQVGICTSCSTKFRVPAKKAATPVRPKKGDEESRRPASRKRDKEEDEEDDEEDDEEEEEADKPRKDAGRPKAKGGSSGANMALIVGVVVGIILLGLAGVFIHFVGIIVACISAFLLFTCSLMVARDAWSESPTKFMMVWLIPLYFIYYAIANWERTGRTFMAYVMLLTLALVSLGASFLYEVRAADYLKRMAKELEEYPSKKAAIVWISRDV